MVGTTRIHGDHWREHITIAYSAIPDGILHRLQHVQFVLGVDPLFAGLHSYPSNGDAPLSDTAHCAFPFHLNGPADRRVTPAIMPRQYRSQWATAHTLVHELGHALHETIGFDHDAVPVTKCATTNRVEAFAESFTAWCWPGNGYKRPNPRDAALFSQLAG